MNKNTKLQELKRWLKTSLKHKISINDKTIIAFLMAGFIGLMGQNLFAIATIKNGNLIIGENLKTGEGETGTTATAITNSIVIGNGRFDGGTSTGYAGWLTGNYSIKISENLGRDSSGTYNFNMGDYAYEASSGNYNFTFGEKALEFSRGDYNFTFGKLAGFRLNQNNDSKFNSVYNVFIGEEAGGGSKGQYNYAFSYKAGQTTVGNYNVVFGAHAGMNVTGDENYAFGNHAGKNVTGRVNYALGINAGQSVKGNGNYALGENAGQDVKGATDTTSEIKGWSNFALAKAAGNHVIGNHNYAFGENAGNYVGYRVNWNDGVFVDSNNPIEYIRNADNNATKKSGAEHNIALGANSGSYIAGQDNVALGQGAGKFIDGPDSGGAANVAIGHTAGNKVYGNENVAIGNYSGNEMNGSLNISLGHSAANKIKGSNNIAIGTSSSNTKDVFVEKENSISIGKDADATKTDSLAIGTGARATGDNSISIGKGNVVSGNNSGAIGDPSYVSGEGTYVIGNNNGTETNKIESANSGIFGNSNKMTTDASNSRIIGNSNNATKEKVFVLGNSVEANVDNSIYLGDSSAATNDADSSTAGATKEYKTVSITSTADAGRVSRTIALGDFAGHTPVGVVTVGATGKERRIQNVAAGLISATSTDAINGSQLYALATKMTDLEVAAAAAGNSTLRITGDNYDENVDEAANGDKNKANVGIIALGSQKLAINGTKNEITTSVTKDGQAVTISLAKDLKDKIDNKLDKSAIATTELTVTNGKVVDITVEADKTKFVTAENIKNTINGVGFYVKAEQPTTNAGTVTNGTSTLVKAGDEVKFIAGKNVTIAQDGKSFTFSVDVPTTTTVGKTIEYFSVKSTEGGNKNNDGASVTNGIAIGPNASVWNEGGNGKGGIAIGNRAQSHVMTNANHEQVIRFGRNSEDLIGGISIGHNTHSRIGTIDIGNRDYKGAIGDIDFQGDSINVIAGVGATTVGDNSINRGNFSTINGAYNVISKTPAIRVQGDTFTRGSAAVHNAGAAIQGLGSSILGTLNSIEANEPLEGPKGIVDAFPLLGGLLPVKGLMYSGLSSHIIGTGNRINKSNGALIFGAGNEITNSYITPNSQMIMDSMSMNAPFIGTLRVDSTLTNSTIRDLANTYRKYSQDKVNRLASVGIIGGANKADYALFSSINGVGNTLSGKGAASNLELTEKNTSNTAANLANFSAFNQINGYENKGTNVSHTVLTGSWNEVANAENNIITGNNHIIKGTETDKAKGNIVLGFNELKDAVNFKTSAENIVSIGNDIVATENNSVYLGNGSKNAEEIATKGTLEYKSASITNGDKTITLGEFAGHTPTGIISVGSNGKERRIQNVAAGLISEASTDAINGSQLYSLAKKIAEIEVNGTNNNNTNVNVDVSITGDNYITVDENPDNTFNITTKLGEINTDKAELSLKAEKDGLATSSSVVASVNALGNNTISLSGNSGETSPQNLNQKDGIKFTIEGKGAIETKAEGNKVVIDLTSEAKEKLEHVIKSDSVALSGVANAVAMANLPQVSNISGHRHNIAGAYGFYKGEHAFAVGLSGMNEVGDLIYKASGSLNTKGHLALGAGLGYQFDRVVFRKEDKETLKRNGNIILLDEKVYQYEKKIENLEKTNKELIEKLEQLENMVKKLMK